jgi:glycosyltransferase involved in cell wall biosynthesis
MGKMELKFTVIIPVYNTEKYLTQCLDSVVSQTYPVNEIILINDGSSDQSYEICKNYAAKYHRIKLISQDNSGQSVARNRGLEIATGNYILFLDSDDWIDLELFNIAKEKLEAESLDALFFDAKIFQENEEDKVTKNIYDRSKAGLSRTIMSGMEFLEKTFPYYYTVSPCLAIFKRSFLKEKNIKFPSGIYYEDNLFTFLFLRKSESVSYISNKLYRRRFRPESTMTGAYSEKKFRDFIKCVVLIWIEIGASDQKLWEDYKELFVSFATLYCEDILANYNKCKNEKIPLHIETMKLFEETLQKYFLTIQLICSDYSDINLVILNHMFCLIDKIKDLGLNISNDIEDKISSARKDKYITLLKNIPLNKSDKKVGIYGTGKHTEGLLSAYRCLIGEITCSLVFLDTYREDGIFQESKVINCRRIDKSFDMIVISSFLYEKEMIKNILKVVPVFTFYDVLSEDVFSCWNVR